MENSRRESSSISVRYAVLETNDIGGRIYDALVKVRSPPTLAEEITDKRHNDSKALFLVNLGEEIASFLVSGGKMRSMSPAGTMAT